MVILLATIAAPVFAAPPPGALATDQILRLVGRFASAHACPIAPREALTNAHVVDVEPFQPLVPTYPYQWSSPGGSGYVVPGRVETARDLAVVSPQRSEDVFPYVFPVAKSAPVPGDRVWLLGYSWDNRKSALGDERIEARVTRIVASHVVFVPSGKAGSSGSCVLNDRGEVVGINEGAYPTEDHGLAGIAVGVWGALKDSPAKDAPE